MVRLLDPLYSLDIGDSLHVRSLHGRDATAAAWASIVAGFKTLWPGRGGIWQQSGRISMYSTFQPWRPRSRVQSSQTRIRKYLNAPTPSPLASSRLLVQA